MDVMTVEEPVCDKILPTIHTQNEIEKSLRKISKARSHTFTSYEAQADMRRLPSLMALALGSVGSLSIQYKDELGDPIAWATFGTSLIFAAMCLLIVSVAPDP